MNRQVKHPKKAGTSGRRRPRVASRARPRGEPPWTFKDVYEALRAATDLFAALRSLLNEPPGQGPVVARLRFAGPELPAELLELRGRYLLALITCTLVRRSEREMVSYLDLSPRQVIRAYELWNTHAEQGCGSVLERAKKVVLAKWPSRKDQLPKKLDAAMEFQTLSLLEAAWLAGGRTTTSVPEIEAAGVTREPWVKTPPRDYFGLALSGGGIRSATFNLGLLQALAEKDVLDHVDYLSTVSGGGYIGGFWTAWRRHHPRAKRPFPVRLKGAGQRSRERGAIRHLREFSRFLIPRVGFMQSETWTAVTAVLGGTLMSLLVMASAVAVPLYLWFIAVSVLGHDRSWWTVAWFGVATLVLQVGSERTFRTLGKLGSISPRWGYAFGVIAAALGALGWAVVSGVVTPPFSWLELPWDADHQWCVLIAPAFVWGASALALLVLRGLSQRWFSHVGISGALDRAISRCLVPALIALALTWIWQAPSFVRQGDYSISSTATTTVGLGSMSAAALFVWLRDWLKQPVQETQGSRLWERLRRWLKPVLPQVAAIVAALLFVVGIAIAIDALGLHYAIKDGPPPATFAASIDHHLPGLWIALGLLVASLFLFDPARVGLHEFYRARIARCFLGAAQADVDWLSGNPRPAPATTEQVGDDVALGELRTQSGPIHLVCCAANNLSGDSLGSLYRGARSAVVSPLGLSIGNFARRRDDLRLSSALTASAAAFNSQMGSYSMRLGPAVAFVMCALNLRLGWWVEHPLNPIQKKVAPGLSFILEALGFTRSDQVRDADFLDDNVKRARANLHLSDGGHFENLGLYELVRRHCRYIIVSDASADPTWTFDDLGNAIRRIREDFGVEIDLDVSHLMPNEKGYATRHAAIGTIHFDGLDGTDKGLIIYFKPVLTGDEPPDIIEHQRRHKSFPHDGTGDQFYDEAQWESYRRLGQHSGAAILSLPSQPLPGNVVDKLFLLANQRWQVLEESHREAFLQLTERCAALESDIRQNAPAELICEFFPEVTAALGPRPKAASPIPPSDLETAKLVYFLMLIAQMIEDVWLSVDLDRRWAHPLNEGWMNYFRRWTNTPSFRTWWPVLRPLHDPRFRDFMKERFNLRINEAARGQQGGGARLRLRDGAPHADGRGMLVYELELEKSGGGYLSPIRVGHLTFTQAPGQGATVSWSQQDFEVFRSLSGAGVESRFLDAVVARFGRRGALRVELENGEEAGLRSPAERSELVQTTAFYKSRGFEYTTAPRQSASSHATSSQGVRARTFLTRPRALTFVTWVNPRKVSLSGDDLHVLLRELKRDPTTKNPEPEISCSDDQELGKLLMDLRDRGVKFDASARTAFGQLKASGHASGDEPEPA